MTETVRLRAIVRGRVQGVGFRWAAKQAAHANGVSGSARNLPDGSVELVLEGPRSGVDAVAEWLQEGPELARVDEVELSPHQEPEGILGFDTA
jgi:acylphosphatase